MTKNNEPEHGSLVSRSSIAAVFNGTSMIFIPIRNPGKQQVSNLKRMLTLLVNIKANCMTVRL